MSRHFPTVISSSFSVSQIIKNDKKNDKKANSVIPLFVSLSLYNTAAGTYASRYTVSRCCVVSPEVR